jgi:glycosyltransferase involved in cell wall biosynthesis
MVADGLMGKPDLLYISPTIPAPTGNGLAMRAAMTLDALAADYAVHLLVIPIMAGTARDEVPSSVSARCARTAIHRVRGDRLSDAIARIARPSQRLAAWLAYPKPALCRFATAQSVGKAAQVFAPTAFRAVHVFRLYMAPFADPYLTAPSPRRPTCRLDLDDDESATRLRLADLHEAGGDVESAAIERSEARKYAAFAERHLPRFDRVYVCSERDRLELSRRYGAARFTVIPNAVHIPAVAASRPPTALPTLLFVANLGYYPNEDAMLYFCREILSRLRALVSSAVRVVIVGGNPSARVRRLSRDGEVVLTGAVPDVAGYYRDADLVIAPLRAGGGTRIKVLEAFAHQRPVVSTSIGAEGIEACHGTHLLLADTPAEFAAECARLIANPELGVRLAHRAFQLVATRHSPEHIRELLRRDHASAAVSK